MACRHDDIVKYEHDIPIIEGALTIAQNIIDYQVLIDASVNNLKTDYNETVNPPEHLGEKFDEIHDGALSNARIIMTQLEGALRTARELLRAAREEDAAFHAENGG